MPTPTVQPRPRDRCLPPAGKEQAGGHPQSRQAQPWPSPAAGAWRGAAAFEGLRRDAHARARLPRRREDREPGRAEADPEPTHEAARRLHENPPLPTAQLLLRNGSRRRRRCVVFRAPPFPPPLSPPPQGPSQADPLRSR